MEAEINESAKSFTLTDTNAQGFNWTLEGIPATADNAGASLNRTTSSLAQLILKTEIFGNEFDARMKVIAIRTDELAAHIQNTLKIVIGGVADILDYTFVKPTNAAIDGANALAFALSKLPGIGAASPVVGALASLGSNPLPKIKESSINYGEIFQKDSAVGIKANLDIRDILAANRDEAKKLRENFDKFHSETVAAQKQAANRQPVKPSAAAGSAGGIGDTGGGRTRKSSAKPFLTAAELASIAKEYGFQPSFHGGYNDGGTHSANSPHYRNIAQDVSIRGKSAGEKAFF